jgi:aldehyde:ferredoxin oxidoreductase
MTANNLYGYNGRFLRVDLNGGKISVEEPSGEYYQRYLGGRGFVAMILLNEVPAKTQPLGPQNKLIFAAGPLTGMPFPGSGRNSVGALSPMTGSFGEAEAGGFWGAELKKAGFDAIVIEGAATFPVYLWIKDGRAELRDARHLWGKEVAQTHFKIQEELGDRAIRTAVIGPAGERLIRFACISQDINHVAGRTGLGAVMGSKKLKGVAVSGRVIPPMAQPERLRNLSRWMVQHFKEKTTLWKYGTGAAIESCNLAGNLPVRNFQEGFFDGAERLSAKLLVEQFGVGMHGCYACPIRCKKKIKMEGPWEVDPVYGGPAYETLGSFGSNCGISDVGAVCKAHEFCNRQGLDTISAGVTLSFAMECFHRGVLSTQDAGGVALEFGNAEAMLQVLQQIVRREGLGSVLAEGSRAAARQIGGESEALAMQVKGHGDPHA